MKMPTIKQLFSYKHSILYTKYWDQQDRFTIEPAYGFRNAWYVYDNGARVLFLKDTFSQMAHRIAYYLEYGETNIDS